MSDMINKHGQRFTLLSQAAQKAVTCLSIEDVAAQLHQKASMPFYLVDVREESEWAKGHIPGAIHLSRGVLEVKIEQAIPDPDAPVILYCGGGNRSALAAESLQKMGYTQVASMNDGFRGWVGAGYPVDLS